MTIQLLSPAKINLGLEVLRKRGDGFHDIATVFQTISLFDRIRIEPATNDRIAVSGRSVAIEENLVSKALANARTAALTQSSWQIDIEKRIPVAAGLGGASSNAAAVLTILADDNEVPTQKIEQLALQLGSDVPFFLHGGAAMATGRGEILTPLPSLRNCWFVLACPEIQLERKTARLYGSLLPADFSNGQRVARVMTALQNNQMPNPADLQNVFSRPLAKVVPEITELIDAFETIGAPFVALTGAGPAQYTIVPDLHQAIEISHNLAGRTSFPLRISVARPMATGIQHRFP